MIPTRLRTLPVALSLGALTAWAPARACGQVRSAELLAAAESALAGGNPARALQIAAAFTNRVRDDPRGWIVLGKARAARGGGSAEHRLQAIWAFRRATELDPGSREAWERMGRMALVLGGADGERIAADAFQRLMVLDPLHPGAWESWLLLYRGRGQRERMRRVLARHDSIAEVRARIARLLIEDERYDSANVVLDALLGTDPSQPAWLALRSQSAYEAGDTLVGNRFYDLALRSAGRDDAGMLWSQVIGIASPAEIRAWEAGIPADRREGFLRGLWARRDPNLFADANARVAEHFARLRYARGMYSLLHPLNAYNRTDTTRAAELRPSTAENAFYLYCEAQPWPGGPMRAADRARLPFPNMSFWPLSDAETRDKYGIQIPGEMFVDPEVRVDPSTKEVQVGRILVGAFPRGVHDVDTTAARVGYNLRTGLDDRGITYLRFGPPRRRVIGAPNGEAVFCRIPDVERWDYESIGPVRFFRPSAVYMGERQGMRQTGDMVFRPQDETQFQGTVASLTRDATSAPADLAFGVWTAQFAGRPDPGTSELAVFATRPVVAAQLVSPASGSGPRGDDSLGLVLLLAHPGAHTLNVHVQAGDSLGRWSRAIQVRSFLHRPSLSDLVVAPAWADTLVDRRGMLTRAPRDLGFLVERPIRVYAEVYGLRSGADSVGAYEATYQVFRTNSIETDARRDSLAGGVTLSFERQRRLRDGVAVEWLDITPQYLQPGRYLVRLIVHERASGRLIGRAQIGVDVRGR